MNKANFSTQKIGFIVKNLPANYTARVNKAGNITVQHKLGTEYYTLYLQPSKRYLWRHHDGSGYCYPLNMRNRSKLDRFTSEYHYEHEGKMVVDKIEYYMWDMKKNAEFETVEEAVKYFTYYINRYRPNGRFF